MVRVLFVSLALLFSSQVFASALKSAARDPGTSYLAYKSIAKLFAEPQLDSGQIASESAIPYDPAKLRAVTEWESMAAMNERFENFRDVRWLQTSDHPGFLRRSSWLYPDDGCFARAGLAIMNLFKMKAPLPDKIFVFGDLNVKTANSPVGSVTWWYHVAPIVQVAGVKYILDPALSPQAPIRLEEWLALQGDPRSLEVAICKSGSYTPDDICNHGSDGIEQSAQNDQLEYLDYEWSRLEELHRNPVDELGNKPPWLSPRLPMVGL